METWRNGQKAREIKGIIDKNFTIIEGYFPNAILAISTEKRKILSEKYLRAGFIVFDTTDQKWITYNGSSWVDYEFPYKGYNKNINSISWSSSKTIFIPFSEHHVPNPTIQLFIKNHLSGYYEEVLGGILIDDEYNITLSTDLPFDGKVVIK